MEEKLIKIGVFYDGNYFLQVSNYYAYGHIRKKRISVSGLHDFIRHQIAAEEQSDARLCHIVDSHYFRGRLSAAEASQRGDTLYWDRVFDDILMSEGVTTHFLPVKTNIDGNRQEKGIDVWLALEAYELAFYKRFNVLVLIASDGDYVPLVRKLNTLGTRVMVLGWDFEYDTDTGQKLTTRTSQDLLEEGTYPVQMSQIIDDRVRRHEPIINNLFVQYDSKRPVLNTNKIDVRGNVSEVMTIKNGFGFIKYPPNNLFFHYSNVIDTDFNDLKPGDKVSFSVEKKLDGDEVAKNVKLLE